MTIIRLSIFSMPYLTKLKALEDRLSCQEQKLALVKKQIMTLQEMLPSLRDDGLWFDAYRDLESLQREELRVAALRRELWAEIKTIISDEECSQKPECEVISILR